MVAFILRRLLQAIPVLLLSSIVVFLIIRVVPGDPARVVLGLDASEEELAAKRIELGIDQPLPVQYVRWLGRVAQGDLGNSLVNRFPVAELVRDKLPATLELAIAAFLLSIAISLPLGIFAALYAGSWGDYLSSFIAAFYLGTPNFWIGMLYIMLFSVFLGVLPPSGRVAFFDDPLLAIRHLILPATTLALPAAMVQMRFIRATMLDVLGQDYVRTARAKGLQERTMILRHALRNTLIPVVTVLGIQFGNLLGGAVIVESLFAWPGVGRMLVDSIGNRDYAITQAGLLYLVGLFIVVNLVVDLLYGFIDPRTRRGGS
jgi:peptide/nickel transport system permease protein